MNQLLTFSMTATLMLSMPLIAEEVTDVEAKYSKKSTVTASDELKQSLNFGFSSTTGSTKTLNINGKYDMAFTTTGYDNKDLKVGFDTALFLTKDEDIKNNEEYTANLGLEQYVWDYWYAFSTIGWLTNEFRNYDNRLTVDVGIGMDIFKTNTESLKIKLGTAYNFEKYSTPVDGNDDDSFMALTEYIEYNNKLNDTSTLYLKVGAMENYDDFADDYEILAVAGLNFAVAENLSLTLEGEARHDSTPVGRAKNDTKTIVRVGYNF